MGGEKTYDLAGRVIGLAMKVHRTLGPGFLESVYENALCHELTKEGIPFEQQVPLNVVYDGMIVGDFICDLLIDGNLIVENKAILALAPPHEVQLVNYLSATKIPHGLLLNFGASSLEFKKKFLSRPLNSVNSVNSVKKSVAAFTLLELLVAVAVLCILVVLLMGMVDSSTRLWRMNENRVDSFREARAALNVMSADLRSIYANTNTNNPTFYTNFFATNASTYATGFGQAFFITALPTSAQDSVSKSDLCAVGYYVALAGGQNAFNGSKSSLNLYRFFRESNATFTNISTSASLYSGVSPGGAGDEILARNIVDFQVVPLTSTNGGFVAFTSSISTPIPDVVELRLTTLNYDAAKRLVGKPISDWTDTNSALIKQNSQSFSTRVFLRRPQ